MYCVWRIPAHLRYTQCSILLHIMDICWLCVLIVEGMSIVVKCYVLSNQCNQPTPGFVQHIDAHGGEVMYYGSFYFGDELGFLNCDIGLCNVNELFEFMEFVLMPFMLT